MRFRKIDDVTLGVWVSGPVALAFTLWVVRDGSLAPRQVALWRAPRAAQSMLLIGPKVTMADLVAQLNAAAVGTEDISTVLARVTGPLDNATPLMQQLALEAA